MTNPAGSSNPSDASAPFALILAGGGGTRLWPASRRKRAKQFLALGGGDTLLGATFHRAIALCGVSHTLVVTSAEQVDAVRDALPDLPPENIVAEPAARNTAAAVGLGAAMLVRRAGPDARFAVLPSDAHIGDEARFLASARLALEHARDSIVTIGVKPTHPETGFGYLSLGRESAPGVYAVVAFVEKPDAARAQSYVNAGYLWNAGMFFLTAGRMLAETRLHMPVLGTILDAIVAAPDPIGTAAELYPVAPATSIDFGIMEKAEGILAVPGDFGWNDVGSWAALPALRGFDDDGNVVVGDAVALGGRGNIVWTDGPFVALTDVDNLIVIATKDAVLVTHRDRAQSVRVVVEALKSNARGDLL